jgi:integrase
LEGLPRTYFHSDDPGVLRPDERDGRVARQLFLRQRAPCFPLAPLVTAGLVGRVALQIMFSCGARASEVTQLTEPQQEQGLWYFPGLAKGAKPTWFPLAPAAADDARALAARVRRHYGLADDAPIPVVRCRERRPALPDGPYLFQWRGRQLCRKTIAACYRLLMFGLVRDDGRETHLHTHLFRHARANLWHQQQGMALAAIGGILNHEDVQTTYRYARPTSSQCLRAALAVVGRP